MTRGAALPTSVLYPPKSPQENAHKHSQLVFMTPEPSKTQYHTETPRWIMDIKAFSKASVPGQRLPANETEVMLQQQRFISTAHINPPSTTFPTPATSLFAPLLLASSNSLTTPARMILRTRASAFANKSPTPATHASGELTRLMTLV